MPNLTVAQTSKQTARQELARRTGGFLKGTTTGAGSTTTAVDSGMAGYGDRYFNDQFVLLTSGTYSGHYRQVSDYTSSTGTFTWLRALAGGSGSAVTYEVYPFAPTDYTQALREACARVMLRPARWSFAPKLPLDVGNHGPYTFALPSSVFQVRRVEVDARLTEQVEDEFNRADSASNPGSGWTAVQGTWGISTNRLYNVSDTNNDVLVRESDPYLYDGWLRCVVSGTLASATDYRTPDLLFRYGSLTNTLAVRLVNSTVLLVADTGSDTTLATGTLAATADGTDYEVVVRWEGPHVQVWVDGVMVIDHTLTGAYISMQRNGNVGFRLSKASSPATAEFWKDYRAHALSDAIPVRLWDFERPALRLEDGYSHERLITVHGVGTFTQPALDTTDGVMTTDSTSVIECPIENEPVWELLMNYATAFLYRKASFPGNRPSEAERNKYREMAQQAFTYADREMALYMPQRVPATLRGVRY